MDFSSFGIDLEPVECKIEIQLGNAIVQQQTVKMPYLVLEAQCRSLVEHIANENRPMKIIFSTKQYMEISESWKDACLVFRNNTYLNAFPDEE